MFRWRRGYGLQTLASTAPSATVSPATASPATASSATLSTTAPSARPFPAPLYPV